MANSSTPFPLLAISHVYRQARIARLASAGRKRERSGHWLWVWNGVKSISTG
jgi:hypothetical protein